MFDIFTPCSVCPIFKEYIHLGLVKYESWSQIRKTDVEIWQIKYTGKYLNTVSNLPCTDTQSGQKSFF